MKKIFSQQRESKQEFDCMSGTDDGTYSTVSVCLCVQHAEEYWTLDAHVADLQREYCSQRSAHPPVLTVIQKSGTP